MTSPLAPLDPANDAVLGFGITLAQVKTYLGYALNDPSVDFKIIMTFNAAIATMGAVLGRNLVYGSYRDSFNPMFEKVYLRETPVAYLYQISDGTNITPDNSYQFFSKTGLVEFNRGMWFNYGRLDGGCGNTHVDYVGGYVTLPANLQLALFTALQSADVYQKQVAATGTVVKRLTVYDVGVTEYATSSSTASVLSDTLSSVLASYLPDGGYAMGTPNIHESELMGPPGFWDPSESLVSLSTKPRFGLGGAAAFNDLQDLLNTMTDVPNGTTGGHSGSFTLTTSAGMYGWVAVEATASIAGVHFFDGVGFGGWSGAGLLGNNADDSPDPTLSSVLFTDSSGAQWRFFRQDYVNANPSPASYTLS